MKWIIFALFICSYLYVTLFGVGPLLLADGSTQEKMELLALIVLAYVVLTFLFVIWLKKRKEMINSLIYTIVSILFLVATYLGIGTVFLSERPIEERVGTLGVSLFIYVILTIFIVVKRKKSRK
jgi:uncharacterized membrane protein